ncbi:MAG: arylamine N-acetyltransferase [Candidatus Fermentibacteraceae bacterium]
MYDWFMERHIETFFDHFGLMPEAGVDRLHDVAAAFSRIPWENLTKFLLKARGEERLRMPGEVFEGFARDGTGGTCYSLTEALGSVLSTCGWSVRPLTGHMRHGRNIHCALLVEGGEGVFLLDPGFVVPLPVRLGRNGGVLDLPGRRLIWTPKMDGWDLHSEENGGRPQWRYHLESRILFRNEFITFWKDSFNAPGLNSLHINLSLPDRRLSAHNGNLRIAGGKERENVKLVADYGSSVAEAFGLSARLAGEAWSELTRLQGERRGRVGS